jgi:hypothetical protein
MLTVLAPKMAHAQMIDFEKISDFTYRGRSIETFKGTPCQVSIAKLEKNFMGRLEQIFELQLRSENGNSVTRKVSYMHHPVIKVKAPNVCNKETQACMWEFLVTPLVNKSSGPKKKTTHIQFESYVKDPFKFYLVSVYETGEATGKKVLQWDCGVKTVKKN